MDKNSKKRTVIKRIILTVVISLILIYIVFLFITTKFIGNNSYVTETVYRSQADDVIKTTGFVVRDEEYIEKTQDGILVYELSDGEKVTAGGDVASVYNDENDAINQQKLNEIDDQIAYFEELNKSASDVNVGLDTVNNQLNEKLISLIQTVNDHNFEYIKNAEDELMSSIYRKQYITGENNDFSDRIAELTKQKKDLSEQSAKRIDTIKTDSSGYFSSKIDGYENSFDIKKLDEITYTQLSKVQKADVDEDKYTGKIIKGINWYIVCPVTEDEANNITHSSPSVSIKLPYATNENIPATVVSINQFSNEEKAVLVLECKYMSAALSEIRNESVDIIIDTYEGFKISKSALHDDYVTKTTKDENGNKTTEEKKVQGVYVVYGEELVFKQVCILYSDNDYVICEEQPDSEALFNGETIELYDKIIVQGSDLSNGKLIK